MFLFNIPIRLLLYFLINPSVIHLSNSVIHYTILYLYHIILLVYTKLFMDNVHLSIIMSNCAYKFNVLLKNSD